MDEPPAKKTRVHFGSLEEQEKKRLAEAAVSKTEDGDVKSKGLSAAVRAGIEAGNINIADGEKLLINVVTYVATLGLSNKMFCFWSGQFGELQ